MKFRHLLPVLAMCSPLAALAVPAYPGLIRQQSPDGSVVEIRLQGDEYFSYATDASGQWLMKADENGRYAIAMQNGARVAATAENIEALRAEMEPAAVQRLGTGGRYARLDTDGRSLFPTVGQGNKFLVVLLEYKDVKFTMSDPVDYYTRWLNQVGFNEGDLHVSAYEYFSENSYGKFKPNFVVAPKVTLPKSSKYYVGSGKYALFSLAISTALDELESNGFDFSQFDVDNDGKIDMVYFIYAGYGQADTGDTNTIWPHKSDMSAYGLRYDGKLLSLYACSNELRGGSHYYSKDLVKEGIGTFCHEFSHVLGLPDLYDPNYSSSTEAQLPGDWSLMCNGPYLDDSRTPPGYSAYDRWVCRWMEYTDLTSGQEHNLPALGDSPVAYRLKVPTTNGKTEYYVFETRYKERWDAFLPQSGMLVWHVDYDESVWNSNRVNSTAGRARCTVIPPVGCHINQAAWPASGVYGNFIATGFPNALVPANSYNQSSFKFAISPIVFNAGEKKTTFRYEQNPVLYSEVPNNVNAWRNTDAGQKGFNVNFTAPDGATGYLVTVERRNSSGNVFTVDGYDNRRIESTFFTVNESEAMMAQPHRVQIRAIGPMLPSSAVYDSGFTINPATLAVGTVTADDLRNDIRVENGRIIAPEGAVVRNMAGMTVNPEAIPAGIYLVTLGSQTVKVLVP